MDLGGKPPLSLFKKGLLWKLTQKQAKELTQKMLKKKKRKAKKSEYKTTDNLGSSTLS